MAFAKLIFLVRFLFHF